MLTAVEIEPTTPADSSVIWLHGLGADGHDFVPIVPDLGLSVDHRVRFIFPHAPQMPVTINAGMVMPAWFDIEGLSSEREVNTEQLATSSTALHQLIDREIERGIDSRRIVIAGFSQGGSVAYRAALTYPQSLAGLLALSTYFVDAANIIPHSANTQLPIHIFHGTHDTVVSESLGHAAKQILQSMGFQPSYSTYPIEHSVCAQEITDIGRCLHRWLGLE